MSTNAKTRYNISKVFGPAVPYNIPEDSKTIADNMAGIAINENIAYCAKRSQTFSDIFVIENISTAGFKEFMNKTPISVSIPYAVHGMTYHNNYLYMTCYKNKIIKMPVSSIGKIAAEYTVTEDGNGYIPQSITYYGTVNNEDLFIVGVEKMQKNGAFFYMIGSLSNGKFVEKKRFYVNNSAGYEQPQDIFYHSKYGLFIVTNKKADGAFTIYNMLLCAKIPDELSSVENIGTYYPTSEFRFNGNSNYSKLVVKSIYITDDGTLYLSTNATTASTSSDSYDKDAIFRATNPVFKKDGILEVALSSKESRTVPNLDVIINGTAYTCENLGAFALDGTTGYCLLSHTTDDDMKDKASVLLSSPDISSKNFTRVSGSPVLRTMGHGNGMTYANGYLFVAAYDRAINRNEIAQLDPATGNLVETYQCEHTIGGISYYGYDSQRDKDLFIVVNYDYSSSKPYAENPEFFIGYLESGKFTSIKNFRAQNPSFKNGSQKNVLQDIFYSPSHGLFYVTFTGTTRIYRLLPEQIEQASDEPLVPVAVYNKDDAIYEIESLAISDSGTLYIAQNCNSKLTKDDAVTQIGALSFISK